MYYELNKRFLEIIHKCQELRKKHVSDYEEKCKKQIERFSKEIITTCLIDKCEDVDFAKSLCIKNCLQYESEGKTQIFKIEAYNKTGSISKIYDIRARNMDEAQVHFKFFYPKKYIWKIT